MKSRERTIAAITAAIAVYMEEEKAVVLPILWRKPVKASSSWSSSGREEIMRMRMLWQRRIVPKVDDIWQLSRVGALSGVKTLAKGSE